VAIEAPEQRYPAEVEAAAYFVVAEGLTNIARYADASAARVVVRNEGERLVVRVTDDGRGGADPGSGTGLRGLADRLAAIGGELTVTSEPGSGTTLQATLPAGT
jgi:signal transduction histidine kinase